LPSIRIKEHKLLFDEDDNELNKEAWQELFAEPQLNYKNAKALKEEFEKYLENLPQENKPNTDSDKQKEFIHFCADKRVNYKFNKRCDHRHHAVDAAIIGLCDLSMVQKASAHNAKHGTLHKYKYTKFENGKEIEVTVKGFMATDEKESNNEKPFAPLYNALKEQTRKYLTGYTVWHKPDHFPSGALFKDFAYDVVSVPKERNKRLVRRYFLSDILGKETDLNKLIKKLEVFVEGDILKQEIIKQLKYRMNRGLTLKEALLGKDENDGIFYRGNKINRLRGIYQESYYKADRDKQIAIFNKNKEKIGDKYYMNDGFACIDFDAETKKRIDIIPYHKYYANKSIPNNIIRVFAGDTLFDKKSKNFYKVQSFKFRDGLHCVLHSEVNDNGRNINSLKDMQLIKTRADIAKIKSGKKAIK
jgi:hypothetical protein